MYSIVCNVIYVNVMLLISLEFLSHVLCLPDFTVVFVYISINLQYYF